MNTCTQVDTGELSQVRNAARELDSEPKIHCLVCNAGALYNDKRMTSEGNEATISSHLFGGSYLLTKLLLPKLQLPLQTNNNNNNGESDSDSNSSRVIYVSSGGMYNTKFPSWEEATNTAPNQKYDGVMAYAYAKRGQILLAEEFAKLHPSVKFVSCHPGWVDTVGVDEAFGSGKKVSGSVCLFVCCWLVGNDTSLFLRKVMKNAVLTQSQKKKQNIQTKNS